jgi:hypothetical protein
MVLPAGQSEKHARPGEGKSSARAQSFLKMRKQSGKILSFAKPTNELRRDL